MARGIAKTLFIGSWPTPERPVRVTIPAGIANDLRAFQKVQAAVLDRLGCSNCCSGLDIRFETVRSFAVDEKLKLQELVGGGVITEG